MSTLLPNSLRWGILEVVGIEGIKPPCTKEGKTKRQRRKMRGARRVLLSKDKSVLEMNYFHQLQVTCRVQLAEAICSTCLWLKTPLFHNMDKSQRWMGTKHFRCRIQRCSAGSSEQSQMCHKPRSAEGGRSYLVKIEGRPHPLLAVMKITWILCLMLLSCCCKCEAMFTSIEVAVCDLNCLVKYSIAIFS